MVDIFPFPTTRGNTPEEKIAELTNYLIQFKETLEFALDNISTENLSPELVNKLNELGANAETSINTNEEDLAQITTKKISFTVNFDNGHLEYTVN